MKNLKRIIVLIVFFVMAAFPVFSMQETKTPKSTGGGYRSLEKGDLLYDKGDFKQAKEAFQTCLDQATESLDKKLMMECFLRLGFVEWNLGEIQPSAEYFSKTLSLAEELNHSEYREKCRDLLAVYPLYEKGKKFRSMGEAEKSKENFSRAVKIAHQVGSREHELKCMRQMSISYWNLNELDMFLKLNEKTLDMSRSLNHKLEEGRSLNHIGLYFWKTTDYSKALSYYFDSLAIAKQRKEDEEVSSCLNNIGIIYKEFGYYDQALSYLHQALEVDRRLGIDQLISIDLNNLGTTYFRKSTETRKDKALHQALVFYKECLRLSQKNQDRRTEVQVLNNIGEVYINLYDYERAGKYLRLAQSRSKNIQDRETVGMILNNIGAVHLFQKKTKSAMSFFKKAIAIGDRIQSNNILWEAKWRLGQCFEFLKRDQEALEMYEEATLIIDHIRSSILLDSHKAGYIQHKLEVYESLIDLTFKIYKKSQEQKWAKNIFHIVERAKARSFVDVIAVSRRDMLKKLDPVSRKREAELSLQISSLQRSLFVPGLNGQKVNDIRSQLIQAENEYMIWLSRIRKGNPAAARNLSPSLCFPRDLQARIPNSKTAVFEYYLGENRSYLFVITRERYKLFALPSRMKIQESLRAYLKMLSDPPESEFKGFMAAERLFHEFLFPLDDGWLSELDHIIIIPDGVLHYLPFETLVINPCRSVQRNKMLIQQYKVSYAPSASLLCYLLKKENRPPREMSLLAFGSPSFDLEKGKESRRNNRAAEILKNLYMASGYDFSPLKYGKKEVQWIAKEFPSNKSKIYIGNQAKEQVVKSIQPDEFRIVHFACHGFLDERYPHRSALLLSPDKHDKEDGFLQVREIYNLKLFSDLVVLSGCQTGRGKMARGEGILGLPRTFFYAGARSVLSSVWAIADKPTALFMKEFYYHLSRGEEKVQALRLAKLKMIHSKYSHPFFWAAFVLYGDSSSICYPEM